MACILSKRVLAFHILQESGGSPWRSEGKNSALKDIKKATEEELENCVDNAVAERYGGEIEVADKSSTRKSAATQARDT